MNHVIDVQEEVEPIELCDGVFTCIVCGVVDGSKILFTIRYLGQWIASPKAATQLAMMLSPLHAFYTAIHRDGSKYTAANPATHADLEHDWTTFRIPELNNQTGAEWFSHWWKEKVLKDELIFTKLIEWERNSKSSERCLIPSTLQGPQ